MGQLQILWLFHSLPASSRLSVQQPRVTIQHTCPATETEIDRQSFHSLHNSNVVLFFSRLSAFCFAEAPFFCKTPTFQKDRFFSMSL